MTTHFLSLRNLSIKFSLRSGSLFQSSSFYAVRNLSLDIHEKETFCLIGESGSGKTTLIWAILGLLPFQEGEIIYRGRPIIKSNDPLHKILISGSQIIFQDPVASLSPFLTLRQSIEEPLRARGVKKKEREATAKKLALETGLSSEVLQRRPSMVSGGQNQRACIARALSAKPNILFLDEPLTSLDAVIQGKVAKQLCRIQKEYSLTCFLVTHNLDLVKNIGTTVAVMYLGKIVEKAPVKTFFSQPCHPYSRALLSSVLKPGVWQGEQIILKGDIPSPQYPPSGCVFHPRCNRKLPECEKKAPAGKKLATGHEVFCHLF